MHILEGNQFPETRFNILNEKAVNWISVTKKTKAVKTFAKMPFECMVLEPVKWLTILYGPYTVVLFHWDRPLCPRVANWTALIVTCFGGVSTGNFKK